MAGTKEYVGTGEQLEPFIRLHPKQLFKLTPISEEEARLAHASALHMQASHANMPAEEALTLEEEERLLDELAERGKNLPVLPPEANSREWIYRDHD